MIWFYIISFIFYTLGFLLRSCLYQTVSGSSRDVPIAKQNPEYRERVPTPIWQVLLFIIGFTIPVMNLVASCFCVAWGLLENSSEFHLYKANAITQFIDKIIKFLNKSI